MGKEIDMEKLEQLAADADATHLLDIEATRERVYQEEPYCPHARFVILGALKYNLLKAYKGLTQEEVVREFESPEEIVHPGRIALLNVFGPNHRPPDSDKMDAILADARNRGTEIYGGRYVGRENLGITPSEWKAAKHYVYFESEDRNKAIPWRYCNVNHIFGVFEMVEGRKILVPHAVWTEDDDDAAALLGSNIRMAATIPQ
ncbi:hypothetical protein KY336_00675 [Candidatus Woesearchaeota archaeon]|nr:hypothetical protein [Candidatus Woesearchaeota archaeon]